jgi:hypothetical protein
VPVLSLELLAWSSSVQIPRPVARRSSLPILRFPRLSCWFCSRSVVLHLVPLGTLLRTSSLFFCSLLVACRFVALPFAVSPSVPLPAARCRRRSSLSVVGSQAPTPPRRAQPIRVLPPPSINYCTSVARRTHFGTAPEHGTRARRRHPLLFLSAARSALPSPSRPLRRGLAVRVVRLCCRVVGICQVPRSATSTLCEGRLVQLLSRHCLATARPAPSTQHHHAHRATKHFAISSPLRLCLGCCCCFGWGARGCPSSRGLGRQVLCIRRAISAARARLAVLPTPKPPFALSSRHSPSLPFERTQRNSPQSTSDSSATNLVLHRPLFLPLFCAVVALGVGRAPSSLFAALCAAVAFGRGRALAVVAWSGLPGCSGPPAFDASQSVLPPRTCQPKHAMAAFAALRRSVLLPHSVVVVASGRARVLAAAFCGLRYRIHSTGPAKHACCDGCCHLSAATLHPSQLAPSHHRCPIRFLANGSLLLCRWFFCCCCFGVARARLPLVVWSGSQVLCIRRASSASVSASDVYGAVPPSVPSVLRHFRHSSIP